MKPWEGEVRGGKHCWQNLMSKSLLSKQAFSPVGTKAAYIIILPSVLSIQPPCGVG